MIHGQYNAPINILLADDDADERYLFEAAVKGLPIATTFKTVIDGTTLMAYLDAHLDCLPDILFLDINMPRKNGKECLIEIKSSQTLKDLIVVMYSTTRNDKEMDLLYKYGAASFLLKDNYAALIKGINRALGWINQTAH
jgi:CheY-like chemotaxis protein